jgi:hypothetical protein
MDASALHAEISDLVDALAEGEELDPDRPGRIFQAIKGSASELSRAELEGLAHALVDLESAVLGRQAEIQQSLRGAGKGRRAMRGYGWLKPNRQGQRLRKKA